MRVALIVVVLIATCACAPAARSSRTAVASERTVRISARQFGSEVHVRVGDVVVVARPAEYEEWDVAFSTDVLRSLNTEQGRTRPPADGWTFAVVARGSTDIALTPFVPRGGTPNVPKFVITVTAE